MKRTIRILLINAVNPHVEVENRYPSLGLAYLASYARKEIRDVDIIFKIIDKDIHTVHEGFHPDLVGISSVSQNFDIAKEYAEHFASMSIPVIMGGIHITSIPECLPKSAILACLGEGEITFTLIIKAFIEDDLCHERFNKIPNLAFRENDQIRKTEKRDSIKDLDSVPIPARDLLHIKRHAYMFTSRGCPYRCVFCASSRYWDTLRLFSAEYVVDEIEMLIRDHKVTMISFFDDLFIAKRSRLEEILKLLERRNILGKVKFTCSCRANMVDNEMADLLSRMGVVSVGMGLESGDEETLRFLKGGSISVERNYNAVKALKGAGIAANASFVIGSPKETYEQIMKTYNFISSSGIDLFDIYILVPFPGTLIWDYAKKRGLVSDNMPYWSSLDVNTYRLAKNKIIVLSEILSKEEIIGLYKKFRRLRFARNLIKVIDHPMKRDIPKMAYDLSREYLYNLMNKH